MRVDVCVCACVCEQLRVHAHRQHELAQGQAGMCRGRLRVWVGGRRGGELLQNVDACVSCETTLVVGRVQMRTYPRNTDTHSAFMQTPPLTESTSCACSKLHLSKGAMDTQPCACPRTPPPSPVVDGRKFFSSTVSITGSMYSSRFSNRKGKPYWMASSSCFKKSVSLKVFTCAHH